MSTSILAGSTSLSTGATLSFTFGRTLWVAWNNGTSDVGTRQQFTAPLSSPFTASLPVPSGASGNHTQCVYDAATGGNLICRSGTVALNSGTGTGTGSGTATASPAAIVAAT